MGRDTKMYEINLTPTTYAPNSEYSKPSNPNLVIFLGLSKTGVPFKKMQARAPLINTKAVSHLNNNSVVLDNIRKYQEKVSKYRTTTSPNFKHFKSRESKDPRMPLFMDGVTSRIALNTLNRKMLETNHFDETYYHSNNQQLMIPRTAAAGRMHKSQSQGSKCIYSPLSVGFLSHKNVRKSKHEVSTSKKSKRSSL